MSEKKKVVLLIGGGTGGHLFPAIGLAEQLWDDDRYTPHLITDERCRKYIKDSYGFKVDILDIRRPIKNPIDMMFFGLNQIRLAFVLIKMFFKIKPSLVIGFGSYVSFIPLLIANILVVPIILHEQNCFVGKVNAMFSRYCKFLLLSFENTKNISKNTGNVEVIGNPVRKEFMNSNIKKDFSNKNEINFLIIGGSQSADIFNNLIPNAFEIVRGKIGVDLKINIVQQVKKNEQVNITKKFESINICIRCSEFFFDMLEEYELADIVIARSGASTISELIELCIPSILIPLKSAAENHQMYNAKTISDSGGGWFFEEDQVSDQILADKIIELIEDREKLTKASKNLVKLKTKAAQKMISIIDKVLNS